MTALERQIIAALDTDRRTARILLAQRIRVREQAPATNDKTED